MAEPTTIIHGDWSKDQRKRVGAVARRQGSSYAVETIAPFSSLFPDAAALLKEPAPVLVGFDFPIGVPVSYGRRLQAGNFKTFKAFLTGMDEAAFGRFSTPAEHADEISHLRPFYPARPGGTRRSHLLDGHGVVSIEDLLRRCDLKTPDRPAACSIFWTLGGNQVGRAAVAGWQDYLRPLAKTGRAAFWPFDGNLSECLSAFPLTVVETYPADAMRQIELKVPRAWSKRRHESRLEVADRLLEIARDLDVPLAPAIMSEVRAGFGSDSRAEDSFDAFVGLLAMIAVCQGRHPDGAPDTDDTRLWEGWIFGQTARGTDVRAD